MVEKLLNVLVAVLIAITVAIGIMFAVGGELPNQLYSTPVYTGTLLNWAYILLGLATVSALLFPLVRLATRPKQALGSLLGLVVLAVVIGVSYSLSDGTPLELVGYNGLDNVPSMLMFSDTIIFTMYFLLGGTVAAILVTEIYRKFI